MKVETTPVGYDATAAVGCALAVLSIALDQQFRPWDMISAVLFSVGIGGWGTIAVLKCTGVIQVRQATPEEVTRLRRKQRVVLIGLVVATMVLVLWYTLRSK